MADPRRTSPLVLPNYPYRDKFTPEQTAEALDRKDRIVETLMDPVGPDGTLLNLPVDMMHIIAFHQAYAGVDVHHDHRQLIEARPRRDETGMFEISEWRPRGEFGSDRTEQPADSLADAKAVAAQMRSQLTPEVRAALATILAEEYAAATAGRQTTARERAENVVIEARELPTPTKEQP